MTDPAIASRPATRARGRAWLLGLAALLLLAALGAGAAWQSLLADDPIERLAWIKKVVRTEFPTVPQISAAELRQKLASGERVILVDVREAEEYAVSHLEGAEWSDPLDPYAMLPLDLDPATPIVAYCSVGYRSSQWVERLREAGIEGAVNLEGSIFEWVAAGLPLVDAWGPVDVVHPYSETWAWLVDEEHRAFEPRFLAASAGGNPPTPEALGPEVAALYDQAGVEGTFVLLVPGVLGQADEPDRWYVHDAERARRGFRPASTFKIVSSLLALETGVASGPDFALPWDGRERSVAPWNRDHDLRSAFRYSVLWFYQEMVRRMGRQQVDAWMARLDYGNGDTGGELDAFWLTGDLRISAEEQVRFLRRLHAGSLPFTERTQATVRELMVLDETERFVLRAKTGWALGRPMGAPVEQGDPDVAWLVGWVERRGEEPGPRLAFFAHNISFRDRSKGEHRAELAKAVLARLGWL